MGRRQRRRWLVATSGMIYDLKVDEQEEEQKLIRISLGLKISTKKEQQEVDSNQVLND